jgi:hypothetical protein
VQARIGFDRWRPPDGADAETTRRAWIDEFIVRNSICPGGYQITERRVFLISYGGQIHYRASCL